jgi:hypothetical protein
MSFASNDSLKTRQGRTIQLKFYEDKWHILTLFKLNGIDSFWEFPMKFCHRVVHQWNICGCDCFTDAEN